MISWAWGIELGVLFPSGLVIENLRSFAWQMGLEFEGHARRGFLGSSVQIRVSGEASAVHQYAQSVINHWN
jgi:hypothetical protein